MRLLHAEGFSAQSTSNTSLLSAAMQWLNVSYSTWLNAKQNGRVGHVFQGRFANVINGLYAEILDERLATKALEHARSQL